MKRVHLLVALLSLLVLSLSVHGQDPGPITSPNAGVCPRTLPQEGMVWTGSFTTGVATRSFGSWNQSIFYNDEVGQSTLTANWKNGNFSGSFSAWYSQGASYSDAYKSEVDLNAWLNYATPVADVSVGFGHYLIGPQVGSDVESVSLKASKTLGGGKQGAITPYVKADYYWPVGNPGPSAGIFLTVGASHALPLGERVTLNNQIFYMRDFNGAFNSRAKTNLIGYNLSADFGLGKSWTLSPLMIYGGGYSDPARRRVFTFGVFLTKSFSFKS